MSAKFILEEVAIVENEFSSDSRDKEGVRVVSYDKRRSLQLHLAISHIVQIEVVKDSKEGEERAIINMSSGSRFISRRSARDVLAAIEKAHAKP